MSDFDPAALLAILRNPSRGSAPEGPSRGSAPEGPSRGSAPEHDLADFFNARRRGFELTLGLVYTHVGFEEVAATVLIQPSLHQPYGIVHGGVYASIAETLASVGAAIHALACGQTVVGVENSTSFLRAVRSGSLHGRAWPQHRGQRTQMWNVEIGDDEGRVAASARVRVLNLEGGATIAGETVTIRDRP